MFADLEKAGFQKVKASAAPAPRRGGLAMPQSTTVRARDNASMKPSLATEALLQDCATEPIHLLGRTQRFGVLLAFDRSRRIAAVSGNTQAWCGQPPQALLGAHAHTVLPQRSVDAAFAHAQVAAASGLVQHLHNLAWPGRAGAVDVSVHTSGGLVVVEAEPSGDEPADAALAIEVCTRELAARRDIVGIAQSATTAIARITGFDRVMVYRFAADGSGTVIAEERAPGLESFLGLRYPASDIPPQARRLYLSNPIRVIADAHDDGLPLLTANREPIDLSMAALRSVSPVHLQYLRNMGTAASMSVSLIVDGRLWGLIACHHRRPLRPTLACRAMSELLGRLYSMALARAERQPLERDIKDLLLSPAGVDPLIDPEATPSEHAAACAAVSRLMDVTGVVTHLDGGVGTWGLCPTVAQIESLVAALPDDSTETVLAVESLEALQPDLRHLSPRVAGMLAIRLPAKGRGWVLLLRDEVVRHVKWAGNPDKAISRKADGTLCPRASFAAWRASVRGHCEPWTLAEQELAGALRTRLVELLAARHEQRAIDGALRAAHQQALLVRELNHRVRNMLGLIKGLVQQTARSATSVEDLTTRLHDRVHALSRAYTQIERSNWQPSPLSALLHEETGAFAEPGQVVVGGGPVQLEPHAYISFALVIHELATNARKYGALSVPQGRVAVQWQVSASGALEIDWRETGGPPVTVPSRRGFGTRVIREALEHHLGGHATLDFEPDGLHASLQARSGYVPGPVATRLRTEAAPATAQIAAAAARKAARPALVPGSALVVDDDLVIAILSESMLQQLGCGQVITAGTASSALRLLDEQRVDIALLDVNLGDHTGERVAERLVELGVPTVVTTGYSGTDSVPASMRRLQRLCKPFTQAELALAVDQALSARA